MHVLIASGGLAKYEVKDWVKLVAAAGVSLAQLDRFGSKIRMPKNLGKLRQSFFQNRVTQEPNTCIKCFGAELLLAAPILELFMQMCVRPASILEERCQCLQRLLNILALLGLRSAVLPYTATLRAGIVSHNDLFRRLYPNCVKPKFHWMYHLADCIERVRVNLCCFAPERKHRSVKELAAHVTNQRLAAHVTTRLGYDTLQFFQEDQRAFEPMKASKGKPKQLAWAVVPMRAALQKEVVTVHGCAAFRTPARVVYRGDFVYMPSMHKGFEVEALLMVRLATGRVRYVAQGSVRNGVGDALFAAQATTRLLMWDATFRAVPYTTLSTGELRVAGCLSALRSAHTAASSPSSAAHDEARPSAPGF